MSIKSTYPDLLSHVGKTVSINDFLKSQFSVALRHDIDYDLDLALEFAHLEHSLGYKSTYFLLDTADYWHDPKFADKALQIQDFGHEVGLHVNSLAKWASGRCDNPESDFKANLKRLRDIRLEVSGIAAHGDPDCYHYNAANYWMFSDLRPENPQLSEHNITAEGIVDQSTSRTLVYPTNGKITNVNGDALPLWQTSMSDNGVNYHASHIEYDQYFSDSGGSWRNNLNPMDFFFDKKRTQILIHPEHWRGEKKVFFFLSTARSGSKWLSEVLDNGTSCAGAHEFTLNYEEPGSKDIKNTLTNFQKIQTDDRFAQQLVLHSAEYINKTTKNWAECNVYLPHVLSTLIKVFPNASYIHLKRNSESVVNSLINRNWYDTPNDTIHPIIDFASYNAASQIQRCVSYVLDTQNTINAVAENELDQEKLVTDFEYFTEEIEALGIAVYPRLAKKIYYEKINKNKFETYASPKEWTNEMHMDFKAIVQNFQNKKNLKPTKIKFRKHVIVSFGNRKNLIQRMKLLFGLGSSEQKIKFKGQNLTLTNFSSGLKIRNEPDKHSNFSIAGSSWYNVKNGFGFEIENDLYFDGCIELTSEDGVVVSIFCIFFENGKQIKKRLLYNGPADGRDIRFSFAPVVNAEKFDIFCYVRAQSKPVEICLTKFTLAKNILRC